MDSQRPPCQRSSDETWNDDWGDHGGFGFNDRHSTEQEKKRFQGEPNTMKALIMTMRETLFLLPALFYVGRMGWRWIRSVSGTARQLSEECRGVSGHAGGSPHVQVFQSFADADKNSGLEGAASKHIDEHDGRGSVPADYHSIVRQCRVKQCSNGPEKPAGYGILMWALFPEQEALNTPILEAVKISGGDVREGTASPTPAERQLGRDIASIQEQLEGVSSKGKGKSRLRTRR